MTGSPSERHRVVAFRKAPGEPPFPKNNLAKKGTKTEKERVLSFTGKLPAPYNFSRFYWRFRERESAPAD
jgi:hypothetical protein